MFLRAIEPDRFVADLLAFVDEHGKSGLVLIAKEKICLDLIL
jgi:hypothetical protein